MLLLEYEFDVDVFCGVLQSLLGTPSNSNFNVRPPSVPARRPPAEKFIAHR
jgi:hypothetical protein